MTATPTPLLGRVARDGLMILHERAVKARSDGLPAHMFARLERDAAFAAAVLESEGVQLQQADDPDFAVVLADLDSQAQSVVTTASSKRAIDAAVLLTSVRTLYVALRESNADPFTVSEQALFVGHAASRLGLYEQGVLTPEFISAGAKAINNKRGRGTHSRKVAQAKADAWCPDALAAAVDLRARHPAKTSPWIAEQIHGNAAILSPSQERVLEMVREWTRTGKLAPRSKT